MASYPTMDEWRVANEAWKQAGRPKGQRPSLAVGALFDTCSTCGGVTIKDMAMAPAFPTPDFLARLCTCPAPLTDSPS